MFDTTDYICMISLYTVPHHSEFELFTHHMITLFHFIIGREWTSFPRQVFSINPTSQAFYSCFMDYWMHSTKSSVWETRGLETTI